MSASQAERHRFEPGHPLQNLVDRGFFLFVEESETGTIKPADIGDKKVWELSPYLFLIWRGKPYSLGSGGGLQTRRLMDSISDFASMPPTPMDGTWPSKPSGAGSIPAGGTNRCNTLPR